MSSAQFFIAMCLPLVVILVGFYFQNTGIRDLRSDMNLRFSRFDQKIDDLTNKLVDVDNHLVRVEERLSSDWPCILVYSLPFSQMLILTGVPNVAILVWILDNHRNYRRLEEKIIQVEASLSRRLEGRLSKLGSRP